MGAAVREDIAEDAVALVAELQRLVRAAADDGPTAARRQLGADALLTLAETARLIPGQQGAVRAWVLRNVRARKGPTQPLYRWGDVLAAMPVEGEVEPRRATVVRVALDDDLPPIKPRTTRKP